MGPNAYLGGRHNRQAPAMIAVWWSQYGEYVELRLYPDEEAFYLDQDEVLSTFTSYAVLLAEPVSFS